MGTRTHRVVARDGALGEDLARKLQVPNAQALAADDHPVDAPEPAVGPVGRAPGGAHADIVRERAEDAGREVHAERLDVARVLKLRTERGALVGDARGRIEVQRRLRVHEATDLEKGPEERLHERDVR